MLVWTSDDTFGIGDVEYVCRPTKGRVPSAPGRFCLVKARADVEWYRDFLVGLAPRRIVEVGMYDGASLAFCAEIATPEKLVGIDLRPAPGDALNDFIERRGLERSVVPCYGVDQTDIAKLDAIVSEHFGGEPLDLVVDDASHEFAATRATFNCLFPRLRRGGVYAIEDWPGNMSLQPGEVPLSVLVFELVLACAGAAGPISSVTVERNYALVTRGDGAGGDAAFDLAAGYGIRAQHAAAYIKRSR